MTNPLPSRGRRLTAAGATRPPWSPPPVTSSPPTSPPWPPPAQRLADHPGPREPAVPEGRRLLRHVRQRRGDHSGPEHHVPIDGGVRCVLHRCRRLERLQLLAAQQHHERALQPQQRNRPELPAPADRRDGLLPVASTPTTTAPRTPAVPLLDRPRPALHPPAGHPGKVAQPQDLHHGLAVERTGLDEDQQQPDRRLAQRKLHQHLRRLPGEVRPGISGCGRPHRLPERAERAAVLPARLPRHADVRRRSSPASSTRWFPSCAPPA